MFEKLKEIQAQVEAARAQMKKNGQEALKEAFVEFFNAHPEVSALQWRQYTPYFNDGDPCTFRRNEVEVQLAADEDGEFYDSDYGLPEELKADWDKAAGAIDELEGLIDDDLALTLFDDGVIVTATIDGFEVVEYNHD